MTETWDFVIKVSGVIGIIVAIVKGVQYLYSLMPTAKLDERVTKIEAKQAKDFEHLREIDDRILKLEKMLDDSKKQISEANEGIQRIGKSLISLLNHNINGNGIDKMKEEVDDLIEFFINR